MTNIPSILIIDDNAESLGALAQLFISLGAGRVRQTASAEQAFEILRHETFSIILADYRLTGMDGVEFLEQLRSQGDQTPVVMLSGAPVKPAVIQAVRHQGVAFFPKPFRMAELNDEIGRLLAA